MSVAMAEDLTPKAVVGSARPRVLCTQSSSKRGPLAREQEASTSKKTYSFFFNLISWRAQALIAQRWHDDAAAAAALAVPLH